jgi:hypothetical protein
MNIKQFEQTIQDMPQMHDKVQNALRCIFVNDWPVHHAAIHHGVYEGVLGAHVTVFLAAYNERFKQ